MEKETPAGSAIAREPAGQAAGVENRAPGSSSAPPRGKKRATPEETRCFTPEEDKAILEYTWAVFLDYEVYAAMTEDEVEDEYRRAGKLDKYDPDTELNKRCARVAKKHPPPDGFDPKLEEYFKLIEDED